MAGPCITSQSIWKKVLGLYHLGWLIIQLISWDTKSRESIIYPFNVFFHFRYKVPRS
jgi:hypothetical protein